MRLGGVRRQLVDILGEARREQLHAGRREAPLERVARGEEHAQREHAYEQQHAEQRDEQVEQHDLVIEVAK